MDKSTIRRDLLNKRNSLTSRQCKEESDIIQRKVLETIFYKECDILLAYSDFKKEVQTSAIINTALSDKKEVYLPRVLDAADNCIMNYYKIDSENYLVSGYKGIKEPLININNEFQYTNIKNKKILMLVPGVGFDKKCNRLGFGKGFYDRFLDGKEAITTLGLCYDFQVVEKLPISTNDVPIDFLFTPTKIINK